MAELEGHKAHGAIKHVELAPPQPVSALLFDFRESSVLGSKLMLDQKCLLWLVAVSGEQNVNRATREEK